MAKETKAIEEQTTNEIPLETLFSQLEEVITGLESDEVSLETSFQLYHKGMDLLQVCNQKIDMVEKKMIILDEDGEQHEF
ncbi:MAG: exodeoxyribonuclease VII small subunit [Lachnospiraceae bacterium]